MTLEEIVEQLNRLQIDFALVTRDRAAQPGGEDLEFAMATKGPSRSDDGLSNDPADAAWLFCRGIQRALDYSSAPWAEELSRVVRAIEHRLDEDRDNGRTTK